MSLIVANARIADDARPSSLWIEGGVIRARWPSDRTAPVPIDAGTQELDARGRAVLPGFVDAHTHAIWAGDRLDEFDAKLAGASYLELLDKGGGIMSTVRAVRAASLDTLVEGLAGRLARMLIEGTTTVEVKSGYGLTTRDELKLLEAIALAAEGHPGTVVPTALLGHAIDPEQPHFVESVIEETLPAIHERFPGIAVDAYCERGAWTREQCERLFRAARELGHPLRVHADQFHALGMTESAIELGARSVDHLEATRPHELEALARSRSFGVMLPVSAFHLDTPYPPARRFVDLGGRLVLATNFNPGSAPCGSMPFVIALACRKLGLRIDEAIRACTRSAAELLGLEDRGILDVGMRGDLIVLVHDDPRMLAFEIGGSPVAHVISNGHLVYTRPDPSAGATGRAHHTNA